MRILQPTNHRGGVVGHWLSKAKITGSNPREAASIHFREQVRPKRLHHCIMEFYKSVRGGDVCLYGAYEYLVKRKKANGVTQWRCRDWKKLNCPAKMETRGEEVIQAPSEHSHATDLAGARAKIVMSHMKEDAEQQLASTRNILGTRLEGVPDPVLAKLPKKSSLERRIRGRRQQATLPLPDPTSRDFEIPEEFQDLGMTQAEKTPTGFWHSQTEKCCQASAWKNGLVMVLSTKCLANSSNSTPCIATSALDILHSYTSSYQTRPERPMRACSRLFRTTSQESQADSSSTTSTSKEHIVHSYKCTETWRHQDASSICGSRFTGKCKSLA